jgi:hypothetical protein
VVFLAMTLLFAGCSFEPPAAVNGSERAVGAVGTPLAIEEKTLVAETGRYALWIDPETVSFEIAGPSRVTAISRPIVYRSLPERYDDPEWVDSMLQKNVASLLTVTVLDPSYAPQVIPSFGNAAVTYESLPDGIRILFRFEAQQVTIPLDLTLTDSGFRAQVAPGGVVEEGEYLINQISFLPYFLSGSSDDSGFLFYPDGSGAVSDYRKDYNNVPDITLPVYGFDRGIGPIEVTTQAQGVRMPVFGAKTNDTAYLAVIESPFVASVQTGVNRNNNRYFKNGAVFTYRDVGRVYLRDNETTVNTSYTIPSPVTATRPMAVTYILLDGEETDYVTMADAYRVYLEGSGVFTEKSTSANSAHLTLTGALVKPSSFLGIPMSREIKLTTFEQAGEILNAMSSAGIGKTAVLFQGAQKGGYHAQWTKDFSFNSALGGAQGFYELVDGTDNTIFLNGELLQVYKEGAGFSSSRDAARTTGNGINFQNPYFLLDGTRNGDGERWTLLAPSRWGDAFAGFTGSVPMVENLAIEDAGGLVYSEYEQNAPIFRDEAGPMLTDALTLAKPNGQFALTHGNAYTWGIADTLYNVPLGASGYFLQSGEVPFYQLVVHGYIEYSGPAQNLDPDKWRSFLRSVEYGALPHYSGIYAPSSELSRSALAGVFSACYADWLPDAQGQAEAAGDLYIRIAGQRMTDHQEVSPSVFQTTYENNITVTVDYNSLTFKVNS